MIHTKEIYRYTFFKCVGAILSAAVFIVFLSPGPLWAEKTNRISLATGGMGGVYFVIGGAMANILSQKIANLRVTAEVTAGAVDNAKLISNRQVEIGLSGADTIRDCFTGQGKFTTKGDIRVLMVTYKNYFHFVVLKGKGINSIKDLRGKRVSLGAPGSGCEIMGIRLLEAYGLNPKKDVEVDRLSVLESAGALKDRKIDGFYWIGGLPTGAILDLAATPGIEIKLLDLEEAIPKLQEKWGPVYPRDLIPKGTYKGVDYDVNAPSLGNVLICNAKMDEELAYQITKTILENTSELALVHAEGKNITLQNAVFNSPIPYHPGALRYYKEKGMTIKMGHIIER